MGIEKFNQTKVRWNVNTDGFIYKKLADLKEGVKYPLMGMFVSGDHGYGEGAVLITDNEYVNIPERYVDIIRVMTADDEIIKDIQDNKCAFSFKTFTSKQYHRTGYEVIFHTVA